LVGDAGAELNECERAGGGHAGRSSLLHEADMLFHAATGGPQGTGGRDPSGEVQEVRGEAVLESTATGPTCNWAQDPPHVLRPRGPASVASFIDNERPFPRPMSS
jgi:hypothetical protein